MLHFLIDLYGEVEGRAAFERLCRLLERFRPRPAARRSGPARGLHAGVRQLGLTEHDAILITYGDQVREPGESPLRTLSEFATRYLRGVVSTIHLLPFYPYSSDDGFSVIDHHAVDPSLGTWDDIARLGANFRLMFDAVLNHASVHSACFRAFLRAEPAYHDYFIAVPEGSDLSQVVRPRALPLLTRFETAAGERCVWTTFSADQADLNYHHPQVLLDMLETVLLYVQHGAELIRLDAIAYLWKEIGSSCIHLPQTHRIVQLLRAVLDEVAPHVLLVTETNVPHPDNVSYFGDGSGEAQLVYNFALPPLLLHTLRTGRAVDLSRWAAGLVLPSQGVALLNFAASHDGIGIGPLQGILGQAEVDALVAQTVAHGGAISCQHSPAGGQRPYELNINYFDALSDPRGPLPLDTQVDRFVLSQAIMLSLAGLPGIYFHSLFGSRGWPEGAAQTGQKRTVNRQKCERALFERELADPTSLRHRVFGRYLALLAARASSPAFHPVAAQRVLDLGEHLFAVLRTALDGRERVLCLHNVSGEPRQVELGRGGMEPRDIGADLLGAPVVLATRGVVTLAPYQAQWLRLVPRP